MMDKKIIGVVVFILLVAAGIYGVQKRYINVNTPSAENTGEQIPPPLAGGGNSQSNTYEITYTDAGYSPSPLTIKVGDTVTFINKSSQSFWPASAMHPTHMVYPGSDIKKCGTTESQSMFDACSSHMQGTSWSFRFMEKGKWNYHDHLTASKYGSIIVE